MIRMRFVRHRASAMKEDMFREPTHERASELRETAARLRQWSRQLRSDFIRLQRAAGARGLASPPPPSGVEPIVERKRNGARWMSFALALNWVALAIVDVERHRLAGLLGWYQAQEEGGITPADVAFLTGRPAVPANGASRRNRRRSR